MNEEEKYLFDLNGYLVVKAVLASDEIDLCNQSIDQHGEQIRERIDELSLSGDSESLKGVTGRGDLGGMLGWEKPWSQPFQELLAHPKIVPYLNEILGVGFRMDHNPGLITMRKGAEGHVMSVDTDNGRITVEGVHTGRKHQPPTQQNDQGGIIDIALSINASNVAVVCPTSGEAGRVGYRIEGDEKVRYHKKSGEELS